MADGASEKTEKPTAKRRQDERKKGNVFTSKELNTLAGLFAVFMVLSWFGITILNVLTQLIQHFWGFAAAGALAPVDSATIYWESLLAFAIAALPALLTAGLVAVVASVAQTRGLVAFKALKPKGEKLNPLKGIKRMFSLKSLVELLKSILKLVILAYVVYSTYMEHFPEFPTLMNVEFKLIMAYVAGFVYDMVMDVCIIFVFLAALDYMYQRWEYEKNLRMSKQEIKEEFKQTEGDPHVKSRIRQKQREMSQRRMMQEVPTADVIVRNPTHYAVAIRYKAEKNRAPAVVAKGADLVALHIIRVAEENGVAIMENKPLARGLYDAVPLDREIPEEFYQPVAEVLAFVYSTRRKGFKPAGRPGGV